MAPTTTIHCRHCGAQLRRVFGRWFHVRQIGPVPCTRPEPEEEAPR